MMKTPLSTLVALCFAISTAAAAHGYQSLDPAHPIQFLGNKIVYNGDTIHLHGYSRFLDGNLTDEQIKSNPFVFNDFRKAIEYEATDTMNIPTALYIAPFHNNSLYHRQ